MQNKHHEYFVGLFDILGFENRLNDLGLSEMLEKYESIIDVVNSNNVKHDKIKAMKLHGAFWTAEGGVHISYEIRAAYASDSILVWAKRTLGGAGMIKDGILCHPLVPCDDFLYVCNELICRSLEIGLPLRGAVSMGEAYINEARNIYLGIPLVDIARLEKRQVFIGASPCDSFRNQPILPPFLLPYKSHLKPLKNKEKDLTFGAVLDWPRHWRETRKTDVAEIVRQLNTDSNFSPYYENTLKLIEFSNSNQEYWNVPLDEFVHG